MVQQICHKYGEFARFREMHSPNLKNIHLKKVLAMYALTSNQSININLSAKKIMPGLTFADPESRVRFPALPYFLSSSESGKGSTQPL
jgi:hypothetical protein